MVRLMGLASHLASSAILKSRTSYRPVIGFAQVASCDASDRIVAVTNEGNADLSAHTSKWCIDSVASAPGKTPGWLLPILLSTTAGATDVISFLDLGGLFTAHITGNLVILAAHYVTGKFGQVGPLLSVPMFVAVLGIVTFAFVSKPTALARRAMLILQAWFLICFLGFAVAFGPFPNPDSAIAVFTGMLGVAAMAIQNGLVRLALPGAPATAVMTTNVTRVAVDFARLARGHAVGQERMETRRRANVTLLSVIGFVAGVVAGAILETYLGLWSLAFPVLLAAVSIALGECWTALSDRASQTAHP